MGMCAVKPPQSEIVHEQTESVISVPEYKLEGELLYKARQINGWINYLNKRSQVKAKLASMKKVLNKTIEGDMISLSDVKSKFHDIYEDLTQAKTSFWVENQLIQLHDSLHIKQLYELHFLSLDQLSIVIRDLYVKKTKTTQVNFYQKFTEMVKAKGKDQTFAQQDLLQGDIDNILHLCSALPLNDFPIKSTHPKYSYLFQLLWDDALIQNEHLTGDLRTFVYNLYFIYVMKQNKLISHKLFRFNLDEVKDSLAEFSFDNLLDDSLIIQPDSDPTRKNYLQTNRFMLYYGEYDNVLNMLSGKGELYNQRENEVFEGMLRYNERNGIGILIRKEIQKLRMVYSAGEWKKNKMNGFGIQIEILIDKKISIKRGIFKDSIFVSGENIIYSKTVDPSFLDENDDGFWLTPITNTYEKTDNTFAYYYSKGDFNQQGRFSGHCYLKKIVYYKNESKTWDNEYDYVIEGDFINGKPEGKAIVNKKTSLRTVSYNYDGNFKNGKKDGYGILIYSDNDFIKKYEGFFKDNKEFSIYGRLEFASGDIYEGFFNEKNQKAYLGLYQHYDNTVVSNENYFGSFMNDKKNGLGRFVSAQTKKVLIGSYNQGEKHGNFELISIEEKKEEEDFDFFALEDKKDEEYETVFNNNDYMSRNKNEGIKLHKKILLFKNDVKIDG